MPCPDEVEQLVSADGLVDRDLGTHDTTVATRTTLTSRRYKPRIDSMSELPTWARDALAGVYDPCCREKGISVLDMGLVRSVQVEDGVATVELLLTSGWCPFASGVLTEVRRQILGAPGISDADVSIVWDEAWTTDRLSPRARDILRFLPPPAAVADRDEYIRAHLPAKE
jgi:metal-sulfur cluster biosynthetic enzyme